MGAFAEWFGGSMKGRLNGTVMLVVGSSGLCSDKVGFPLIYVRAVFNVVKLEEKFGLGKYLMLEH